MITLRGVTSRRKLAAAAFALLALAGCTSSSGSEAAPGPSDTCTSTAPAETGGLAGGGGECVPVTATSPAPTTPSSTQPATTAPPLAPQEVNGDCPYLSRQDATDLEGNMVGRVTVVTTDPPGCNFYFAYGDGHMTLQISTQRFADPIAANNAMVLAAQAGANADPITGIGDAAVLYQVGFYDLDAAQDWACAFIKGGLLVIVNTDQKFPSFNARAVAEAVAPLIS